MEIMAKRPRHLLACLLLAAVATFVATPAQANEKVYAQAIHGTVLINTPKGYGTGVLVDAEKRLVVTADHVSADDDNITVVFAEFDARGRVIAERSHYFTDSKPRGIAATVLLRRPDCDLMVLQLASLPKGVQVLPLAADSAALGQDVHVLGNASLARNALFGTRSGQVDSVYRNEPTSDIRLKARVVASSIAANKGDSGGPILNDRGEIVGIVSMATVTWATARKAGPEAEKFIADHPLARQQVVTLGIDVTEIRAILQAAKSAEPRTPVVGMPGRALASTNWTCEIGNGVEDIVFRADGTYMMTTSDAEGVLVDSQRGRYTYAEGRLTLSPTQGEPTITTVTWTGNDRFTFTVHGNQRIWTRR